MDHTFESQAALASYGQRLGPSPHESILPAVGLTLIGYASLSMWVAMAMLLRWVARIIF